MGLLMAASVVSEGSIYGTYKTVTAIFESHGHIYGNHGHIRVTGKYKTVTAILESHGHI